MFKISSSELIGINRNCLAGVTISIALYSYASEFGNNAKKTRLIRNIAIVLMFYTIVCLLAFNGIYIINKNTNLLYLLYSVFTIIVLSSVIFMIFMNLS
tara:strand:- start:2652 stop:2948 length:297 start_codon:yes stop_codon:yes gene_type:complete